MEMAQNAQMPNFLQKGKFRAMPRYCAKAIAVHQPM